MESESKRQFIRCLNAVRNAFDTLAEAQDDCKAMVEAELDVLAKNLGRRVLPAEKAMIKKFAKALSGDKTDSLKSEAQVMAEMTDTVFPNLVLHEMLSPLNELSPLNIDNL